MLFFNKNLAIIQMKRQFCIYFFCVCVSHKGGGSPQPSGRPRREALSLEIRGV